MKGELRNKLSWFDEQIKTRRKSDNDVFENSFLKAAEVIMGRNISASVSDQRRAANDAVGEILRYFHVKPRELPDSVKELNEALEFLLRPHGIMRRNVRLEKGWYKDAAGPMLGFLAESGTVTALIPTGMRGYSFFDPNTKKRIRLDHKTEKMLSSDAVVFYKPFPTKKIGIAGLIRYIAENITAADTALAVSGTACTALIGLLLPHLSKLLFSDVLDSGSVSSLLAMAIFMVCVTISSAMMNAVKNMLMSRMCGRLALSVDAAVMMRILSLPANFFRDSSPGELAKRSQYVNALVNRLLNIVFSTGLTSVFSLIYIIQIFEYAPALVVPSMLVILASVTVSAASAFVQAKVSKLQMKAASEESGMCYALISGIQKIKLSGAEKRAFAKWSDMYIKGAKLLYDPPMFLKVNTVLSAAVSLTGTAVMYYSAVSSGVSPAEYYAFSTAYGMVTGAFMALSGTALAAAQIKPMLETAKPILDAEPEIAEEKQVVEKLSGSIELNNVTFAYSSDMPNVLDGLSLKIPAGQYIAVVGRTGCGKSTLLRILLGFEKPQKGAVYYDGKSLDRIDPRSLRRRIGTVMQTGRLFTGDIYSNIVITDPRLTVDDAWEAAEAAGLADDIRAMPMGMSTMISEGQGGISGGQRQRLLIARAVAPKPKILMFDEATSALDNITQKTVSDSLGKLRCTRIVIAHRLSTIMQCERIIVLDKGRIIEDGTYEELIAKKGFFAELVEKQRIDV